MRESLAKYFLRTEGKPHVGVRMDFIHTIYSFQEINKIVEKLKDPVKGIEIVDRGYLVSTPMCFVGEFKDITVMTLLQHLKL